MMDQVLKPKWVEALRSGDYEQIEGFLCADGKYCCLGVLCDVQGRDYIVTEDSRYSDDTEQYEDVELRSYDFGEDERKDRYDAIMLPIRYLEEVGIPTDVWEGEGGNGDDDVAHLLAKWNDNGKSFNEIADWIERNL
jgi:hypothetical protein